MKKIFLYSLLLVGFVACKKSDEKVAQGKPKADSANATTAKTEAPANAVLKEFSPEQLTKVLQNNDSDTLYVTNFFATWCGPCMQEIPHFRKKMDELSGKPVKFRFVSLDNKTDWPTEVSDFADEYNIRKNVILLDGNLLNSTFFKDNFKSWGGESIPFTLIKKGNESDETIGSMTENDLNKKIEKFLAQNTPSTINNKEKVGISGPKKSLK